VLLRREGWVVNHKRVRRLYRLEGLQLRRRMRRRNHSALHRGPAPIPSGPTARGAWMLCMIPWPMDTRFGCSWLLITRVARVLCWTWGLECLAQPSGRPEIVR
jgi:hypothetical protein